MRICDSEGRELARGLANYSADEMQRLMGKSSQDFDVRAAPPSATRRTQGLFGLPSGVLIARQLFTRTSLIMSPRPHPPSLAQELLGYHGVDTVAHRDNICLTTGGLPHGGGESGDLLDTAAVAGVAAPF